MAIAIRCPDCGKAYNLADDQAGQRVRCRACRAYFDVTERVETLETVPQDAMAERRGEKRPARFDAPEREVRKPNRKWGYVAGGLALAVVMVFLACGGTLWVVTVQMRKGFAQARAQLLADLARANEEARRADRDRERAEQERLLADKQRQAAEQRAAQLQIDINKILEELRKGKGVKLPELAPIKDLDDALAKLQSQDQLTKLSALAWITKNSPYASQQKKKVLDALQPLTKSDDQAVALKATEAQLVVEQDL